MWPLIALSAGLLQTCRNALARSLSGIVSPTLNSWSRFAFNLPFLLPLVAYLVMRNSAPELSVRFMGLCFFTGITQLLGNVALVAAFDRSNFAQSIVFHKLEVAFAALVGVLFFSEIPTATGWLGVIACTLGILVINLGRESGPSGWRRAFHFDTGAVLSLVCAMLLVLTSFALKEATAEFARLNPRVGSGRFEAAVHTLFHTTWIEVTILTLVLILRRTGEFRKVRHHWPRMLAIGFFGFAGSVCWYWAYSLTLVAYVKAVGQIETPFAVLLGLYLWKETEIRRQLPGIGLLLVGIALVLLG